MCFSCILSYKIWNNAEQDLQLLGTLKIKDAEEMWTFASGCFA